MLIDRQCSGRTFARIVSDEAKCRKGGIRFVHICDAAKVEGGIEFLREKDQRTKA